MPKIPNWTKMKDTKEAPHKIVMAWKNDNTNAVVEVKRSGQDYFVSMGFYNTFFMKADTREEAREIAVKWMREHPLEGKGGYSEVLE